MFLYKVFTFTSPICMYNVYYICTVKFLLRTEVNIDPLLQENLVKTMLCLEDTYFSMAEKITTGQNALVICDRGTMDASAFISAQEWAKLLDKLSLEESHICENRYDQVVHMASFKKRLQSNSRNLSSARIVT